MLDNQRTTDEDQNATEQETFVPVTYSMNDLYDTGVVNSKGCDKRSMFFIMICLLLTTLLLHI